METRSTIEYFVYIILPSFIFLFGILGNIFGLIVLQSKKLRKIGPINIYRLLFITDTIYLLSVIKTNFEFYGFELLIISNFWCKGYTYILNAISSIPPMLLVYISLERFVSIRYPNKIEFFRKKSIQFVYFFLIVLFNLIFYTPVIYLFEVVVLNNEDNKKKVCTFTDTGSELFSMIFTNRVLIPFLLMFTASILLINTIFESRRRIQSNYSYRENVTFRKDIKFAITSLTINVMHIVLNLPFILVYFIYPYSIILVVMSMNLFLTSFAIQFYLIIISNWLFRREFYLLLVIFRKRKKKENTYYERTHILNNTLQQCNTNLQNFSRISLNQAKFNRCQETFV